MTLDGSITVWIEHLKAGDSKAVQPLWERYYGRLVRLARKKLGDFPRRAVDEDDVVQSAFVSFCQRAADGQFPQLSDRDNLWAILAVITARKAVNQVVHQGRVKRGGAGMSAESTNQPFDNDVALATIIGREPTPEFAAMMVEQVERTMKLLDDPTHRKIALCKLEGRTNPEIARHIGCSLTSVERKLRLIRHRLEAELFNHNGDVVVE
jgi:RNA polymerase sigma factor (sigma-70 family)